MRITLNGGIGKVTENKNERYHVKSGSVLVFIAPIKDGTKGRKLFLAQCEEGETIPSFCIQSPFSREDPSICDWSFLLLALDKAEIESEQLADMQDEYTKFATKISLLQFESATFDEAILEYYDLNITKELRDLYINDQEQEYAKSKIAYLIYNFFNENKKEKVDPTKRSGYFIYDAIEYICDYQKIKIAPSADIVASCGKRFTVNDIARISHFTAREITLDINWYKKDSGAIFAFLDDGKVPIACVPKNENKYTYYIPSTGETGVVTEKIAEKIYPSAYMFYRPFPNKKMKLLDLMKFGFADVNKKDIFRVILLAIIGVLVGLLIPYINEKLYDIFIPMGNEQGLVQISWVIIACMIGNISFTLVKNLSAMRSMSTMEYSVQSATYMRLFNLPESFFGKYDSADLATRASSVAHIFKVIGNFATTTAITAVVSVIYLFRMFSYTNKLSWISILMLAITMAIIILLGRLQRKHSKKSLEENANMSSFSYQAILGISKIRIAGVEDRAIYEYLKPYVRQRKSETSHQKIQLGLSTFIQMVSVVFNIVLYYLMVKYSQDLSLGQFMGFSAAFGSFSGAFLELANGIVTLYVIQPILERSKPILETMPEHDEETILPGNITGAFEISNVNFAYSPELPNVLNNFSLDVKAGEYIGVVGSSGCGKSTLLKLLLGFEKPQSGKIFYDGMDIDTLDKRELRKKFGVVLQGGELIAGSIYENITITFPSAKLARVKEVIEEVGLKEDIGAMPMGLQTVLSDGGGTISGGQKQRILIARAIVAKPKILFFDEATSSLDNKTQAMVCESLYKLKTTRFVIAHRLSTVMNCDRIIVMDEGKIVEMGTYNELMAKKISFIS